MKLRLFLITALICISQVSVAMSPRKLTADSPDVRKIIATDEFSPFQLMNGTSILAGGLAIVSFPLTGPDAGNKAVGEGRSVASVVFLLNSMLGTLFFTGIHMPPGEREKLGELSFEDVDKDWLLPSRQTFLYWHAFNLVPTLLMAEASHQSYKWNILAAHAALPFVTDLTARYVFRRKKLSPWTLTAIPMADGQPGLAFVASF